MRITESQLRRIIREELTGKSDTPFYPWADMEDPDAVELKSLIINRVGGAGVDASADDDRLIIKIILEKFPGLIDYSRKWLRDHPPEEGNLHRGVKIMSNKVPGLWVLGLKGRGQLSSWSDDKYIAMGFGSGVGMYKGVNISIPVALAEKHMMYSVKGYAASVGDDPEQEELSENEYVLRDFDIPPRYIK